MEHEVALAIESATNICIVLGLGFFPPLSDNTKALGVIDD